jgi:hypothetical protein
MGLVRYPILHKVYLQIYDDPDAELFYTDKILIYVNFLRSSGSETLQKFFYRKNSTMTHFRMIPEPYIVPDVSKKL